MSLDKCNLITAKHTGLIFSLFEVALAPTAAFWHTAVHTMHVSVSSFVSNLPLLTV